VLRAERDAGRPWPGESCVLGPGFAQGAGSQVVRRRTSDLGRTL